MSQTTLIVGKQSFTIPSSLGLEDQKQLETALETFYQRHELDTDALNSSVRKIFVACLQQNVPNSPTSLKALETRISQLQQKLDKSKHIHGLTFKESGDTSHLLQKLLRLSQDFKGSSSQDNALIDETVQLLNKPMRDRLYFHLYLLHASKGKKTGQSYGEKAFLGIDGHSATNQERSKAILHLYIEQLAASFSAVGPRNSQSLMNCFSALPREIRSEVYFKVFELRRKSASHDYNYGRNTFLRTENPQETNRIRGEAIYRYLIQRFQGLNSVSKQAESFGKSAIATLASSKSDFEAEKALRKEVDELRLLLVEATQHIESLERDRDAESVGTSPNAEELERLAHENHVLKGVLDQIRKNSGIVLEDLTELAREMAAEFRGRIDTLSEDQLLALRSNCALMHIKKLEMGSNKHLQVQFEKKYTPEELPSVLFATKTSGPSSPHRIAYKGRVAEIPTRLCPIVAKHACSRMDRSQITEFRDLELGIKTTLAQANAPGTILAQLEELDSAVLTFENSSATPEHMLSQYFGGMMDILSFPASRQLEQLLKQKAEEEQLAQTLGEELANPLRPNRSEAYSIRQQKAIEKHLDNARLIETHIRLLTERHQAQFDLEATILEARKASQEEEIIDGLQRSLRRLIVRENTFYYLTERGGAFARKFLQLEYHLNQLPVGVMRRDPKLRQILSFLEQFRPIVTGVLDELREQEAFTL